LGALPGEPCAIPAILMASLCSLFATSYMVRCSAVPIQTNMTTSHIHDKFSHYPIFSSAFHQEPDHTK
jgi:hypothetical protein